MQNRSSCNKTIIVSRILKQEGQKDIYEHMYLFYTVSRPRSKTLTVADFENIGIENITHEINT